MTALDPCSRVLRRLWKRLPGVDLSRQIPSDDTHRLGQCRDTRCPYTGWHAPGVGS